jgi:hypothetical protein
LVDLSPDVRLALNQWLYEGGDWIWFSDCGFIDFERVWSGISPAWCLIWETLSQIQT